MFKELLEREDVKYFINSLYNDDYFINRNNYDPYENIGLFYDALYKYSILFDDDSYIDMLIKEIRSLFRKLNNLDDVIVGINKILSKLIVIKLGIKNKNDFIDYVYDKYITNGYFIHAYSNVYTSNIINNGFNIDEYNNLYNEFNNIKNKLVKYKVELIEKDFNDKSIFFTDNMRSAYNYSLRSPNYFYDYICNDKNIKYEDGYLVKDYKKCLANLKKIIFNYSIDTNTSKEMIDTFNREWNLLNNSNNNISSFIFVKRSFFDIKNIDKDKFIDKYISEDYDIILDRLINNNYTNVKCSKNIPSKDIIVINIVNQFINNKKEEEIEIEEDNDENGMVSLLILVGVIFICIGSIITLFLLI